MGNNQNKPEGIEDMKCTYIHHCCIGGNAAPPKFCRTVHHAALLDQIEHLEEHLPLKFCQYVKMLR